MLYFEGLLVVWTLSMLQRLRNWNKLPSIFTFVPEYFLRHSHIYRVTFEIHTFHYFY